MLIDSVGRASKTSGARRYWMVWLAMIVLILVSLTGCSKQENTEVIPMDKDMASYSNPFPSLEEEWEDYGNGDPYVLRYNGQYYLYVSTKDHRVGIKAWRSTNLIDWSYIGLVADDAESTGAYAPEVMYWNGKFYLYTSPAGNGHYVYESSSPEGPFQRVTENLGMSIDGSVFIDDDGSWYFTHAGTAGIVGVPMTSPTEFNSGKVIEGAYLGHWTEGSMIIKRNGLYYMTLTGNHVFSKGYRIHYGVSEQSPLGPYVMPAHNPIAIHTEGDFFGLGHSSTVLGPDMDSYYLVYHNLLGNSAEGPPVRSMNIDRLVFNGRKMDLLGPTNYMQPQPRLPEFSVNVDEGLDPEQWEYTERDGGVFLISRRHSEASFTAEYNFSIETGETQGELQFVYQYTDDSNYNAVILSPTHRTLRVASVQDGRAVELATRELLPEMDLSVLHTIRIAQHEHGFDVYWDGLQQLSLAANMMGESSRDTLETLVDENRGGAIGYIYDGLKVNVYYTAFSNVAAGSSDYDVLKPIPGTVEAIHFMQEENSGFHTNKKSEQASIRVTDGVQIEETEQGEYAVLLQHPNDWLRYGVNVETDGNYVIAMTVDSSIGDAELEIIVDDEQKTRYKLDGQALQAVTGGHAADSEQWRTVRLGTIELEQGYQTITVRAVKGKLLWSNMRLDKVTASSFSFDQLLEHSTAEDMQGQWQLNDQWYSSQHDQQDAKLYGGESSWSDYRIHTTVRLGDDASGNAGILLRVSNESEFQHQVTDALMGYYVAVTPTKLELYKLNYDSQMLHAEKLKLPRNEEISLSVEAVAETITVYINNQFIFSYNDANPMLVGKLGLRMQNTRDIELTDLKVTSLTNNEN